MRGPLPQLWQGDSQGDYFKHSRMSLEGVVLKLIKKNLITIFIFLQRAEETGHMLEQSIAEELEDTE